MKFLQILIILFFIYGCDKPQAVLICGDHVCVNKTEAKQYFEENLSLEVKIIDTQNKNEIDLVQLNLVNNVNKREITIEKKNKTENEIKVLSSKEINKIKSNIKKNKKKINESKISKKYKIEKDKRTKSIKKNDKKKGLEDTTDICTLLDNCSIEEISKHLIKLGKKKNFPDITIRE